MNPTIPFDVKPREKGERIHSGDMFLDGEELHHITRESNFKFFIGQPIGKPGKVFHTVPKVGTRGDHFDSEHPEYDEEIWEVIEIQKDTLTITSDIATLTVPKEKFYPLSKTSEDFLPN